jgi:hypothetical protein
MTTFLRLAQWAEYPLAQAKSSHTYQSSGAEKTVTVP